MVLEVEDEITLSTRLGTSVVQLLLGDITDLPVEEKVDIVFTSAFPGDYGAGIPTTLFHALHKNLGISAWNLARNKDLDLRQNFSCWISKPLPEDKPFRRLVCFEVLRNQNITEQISMMFRAIMPIFNGKESTIITPPLATGCQGASIEIMVNLMVNTACNWIKAGLPLTCLKLVLFTRDVERDRKKQYQRIIKLFKSIKNDWVKKEKSEGAKSYDVTFCYHNQDMELVKTILAAFVKEDEKLNIHSEIFAMKEDDSWQDEVFQVLAGSKRVVIVLTPSFVSDKWCHEQFSMGLCCNRLKGDEVIIPFYMETVESFPSYMNLVQYRECRVRKSDETLEGKLTDACREVIKSIRSSNVVMQAQAESPDLNAKGNTVPVYDVFVSYSHRTHELAHVTVETLKKKYPDLNVFLDRSELKSGNIWQQTLYEAVDKAHCMIAFLADTYLKSTVCQEEYNIALGRMKAKDSFLLVPVCLPELTVLPISYAPISPIKISSADEIEGFVEKVVPAVKKIVSGEDDSKELDVKVVRNIQINHRYQDFKKNFTFDQEEKRIVPLGSKSKLSADTQGSLVFAYATDGLKLAACLSQIIHDDCPNIRASLLSFSQAEVRKEIDNADIIVIFVSDEFLQAQHHIEQLHIALCRQRTIKDSTVVYLVQVDHQSPSPFYFNILPFNVCIDDPIWKKHAKNFEIDKHFYTVKITGMQGTYTCSSVEHLALMKIKHDILQLLTQRGQGSSLVTNLTNVVRAQLLNKGKKDENIILSELPGLATFEPYMRLQNSLVAPDEQDDTNIPPDEMNLTQEEEISPEETAKQTQEQRPKDPSEVVLANMNEFFITKQTLLSVPSVQPSSQAEAETQDDESSEENDQYKKKAKEQLMLMKKLEKEMEDDMAKKNKKKQSRSCAIA